MNSTDNGVVDRSTPLPWAPPQVFLSATERQLKRCVRSHAQPPIPFVRIIIADCLDMLLRGLLELGGICLKRDLAAE